VTVLRSAKQARLESLRLAKGEPPMLLSYYELQGRTLNFEACVFGDCKRNGDSNRWNQIGDSGGRGGTQEGENRGETEGEGEE